MSNVHEGDREIIHHALLDDFEADIYGNLGLLCLKNARRKTALVAKHLRDEKTAVCGGDYVILGVDLYVQCLLAFSTSS